MKTTGEPSQRGSIVCYDIETTNLSANFGLVLAGVTCSLGGKPKIFRLDKYRTPVRDEDKHLVKDLIGELDQYDFHISYNGIRFDSKYLWTRAMYHRIRAPQEKLQIDLLNVARQRFRTNNRRLDTIVNFLDLPQRKTSIDPKFWRWAMLGDKEAMDYVVHHCTTPDHKVLTESMEWKEIGSLRVGERIVGFEETVAKGSSRRYLPAEVEIISYTKEDVYGVELSSGEVIKTTADHRWLVGTNSYRGWRWIRTDGMQTRKRYGRHCTKVAQLIPTWGSDYSYDAGWMAGILDGEGSCTAHTTISVAQRPGPVLDRIISTLDLLGGRYSARLTVDPRTGYNGIGKKDCVTVHIRGNLSERLAFLGSVRPNRLLSKIDIASFGRMERRGGVVDVVDVRKLGQLEIARVQTSTGTMIVDGYPMHNCLMDVKTLMLVYDRLHDYVKSVKRR